MATIKILFRAGRTAALETVFEEFPRTVARAYSPVIDQYFQDKPASTYFIVETSLCDSQHCQGIFDWMMKSNQQATMVPFQTLQPPQQVRHYIRLHGAAEYLGVFSLKNEFFIRMTALVSTEFQDSDTVNDIYDTFQARSPLRLMVAKGTVHCFFTGKFGKLGKTYTESYNEIHEAFEEDVRQFFRKEMKDFDPEWETKMKRKEIIRGADPLGGRWYVREDRVGVLTC